MLSIGKMIDSEFVGKASFAKHATTAESIPPESPTITPFALAFLTFWTIHSTK
jgi:hypothetical protein